MMRYAHFSLGSRPEDVFVIHDEEKESFKRQSWAFPTNRVPGWFEKILRSPKADSQINNAPIGFKLDACASPFQGKNVNLFPFCTFMLKTSGEYGNESIWLTPGPVTGDIPVVWPFPYPALLINKTLQQDGQWELELMLIDRPINSEHNYSREIGRVKLGHLRAIHPDLMVGDVSTTEFYFQQGTTLCYINGEGTGKDPYLNVVTLEEGSNGHYDLIDSKLSFFKQPSPQNLEALQSLFHQPQTTNHSPEPLIYYDNYLAKTYAYWEQFIWTGRQVDKAPSQSLTNAADSFWNCIYKIPGFIDLLPQGREFVPCDDYNAYYFAKRLGVVFKKMQDFLRSHELSEKMDKFNLLEDLVTKYIGTGIGEAKSQDMKNSETIFYWAVQALVMCLAENGNRYPRDKEFVNFNHTRTALYYCIWFKEQVEDYTDPSLIKRIFDGLLFGLENAISFGSFFYSSDFFEKRATVTNQYPGLNWSEDNVAGGKVILECLGKIVPALSYFIKRAEDLIGVGRWWQYPMLPCSTLPDPFKSYPPAPPKPAPVIIPTPPVKPEPNQFSPVIPTPPVKPEPNPIIPPIIPTPVGEKPPQEHQAKSSIIPAVFGMLGASALVAGFFYFFEKRGKP